MSGDPIYTEMIIEYSRNPSNFGKIVDAHIHQHDSNPLCGDSIDLYLNIEGNKISDVKFDGKGCAICMACSSVMTEMIKGKSLDDVKKFDKDELLSELGLEHLIKTSPVRIKCALLSLKSLKYGIYSYFADKMLGSQASLNVLLCKEWAGDENPVPVEFTYDNQAYLVEGDLPRVSMKETEYYKTDLDWRCYYQIALLNTNWTHYCSMDGQYERLLFRWSIYGQTFEEAKAQLKSMGL